MARSKRPTQADLEAKAARAAAYAAEWNAAKQAARVAITSQPMPLVASDSDPSAAYGLAESLLVEGERARYTLLTMLARDGVSQDDLVWLCTSGTFLSDRFHAAWWAGMRKVYMRDIETSGLTFREWFDRDVDALCGERYVDRHMMQRIYGSESPSIRREREYARAEWLQMRQGIHDGTLEPR